MTKRARHQDHADATNELSMLDAGRTVCFFSNMAAANESMTLLLETLASLVGQVEHDLGTMKGCPDGLDAQLCASRIAVLAHQSIGIADQIVTKAADAHDCLDQCLQLASDQMPSGWSRADLTWQSIQLDAIVEDLLRFKVETCSSLATAQSLELMVRSSVQLASDLIERASRPS